MRRAREQSRRLVDQLVRAASFQSEKGVFDLGQSGASGQRLKSEIAGSNHLVREFLHRHTEQLAGAAWAQADPENAAGAGGAQEERPGKLSR
jgi:hypothetical protein